MSKLIEGIFEKIYSEVDSKILDYYDEELKIEYDDGREEYLNGFTDYHKE